MSDVTIGITCFNAADTIERAIKSALAQQGPVKEIIVVDDASTDNSAALIQRMAQADARIKFIPKGQNGGYPAALNSIINAAQGHYIAFFDDDDESDPGRITAQLERLKAYQAAHGDASVLCYANRRVFRAGFDKPAAVVHAIGRKPVEPHGAMVADFLLWHAEPRGYSWGQFGSCALMAARQVFIAAGGFDESFRRCAEWDLAVRLAFAGAHFIAVDAPLVNQHLTPTQDKAGKVPLEYALKLREKHKDYLKRRLAYHGARFVAHSRFYYARGYRSKSRLYMALACLASPFTILPAEMRRRLKI